jgi:hypothetical protein
MTDTERIIAALEAELTPDLEAAIDALCYATPDASADRILVLFRTRFKEVYRKNFDTLVRLGLLKRIQELQNEGEIP